MLCLQSFPIVLTDPLTVTNSSLTTMSAESKAMSVPALEDLVGVEAALKALPAGKAVIIPSNTSLTFQQMYRSLCSSPGTSRSPTGLLL